MALNPNTKATEAKANVNAKAEDDAKELQENKAKEDAAKASAAEANEAAKKALADVKPGLYRTKQYKFVDPYTNLTFSTTQDTHVERVTSYFAAQVRAGVLVRTGDLPNK